MIDLRGQVFSLIKDGKLKCSGSSLFLKNNLGDGYHLTMSLGANSSLPQIETFIKQATPTAFLDKLYGNEAQFVLPLASSGTFPTLFELLERDSKILNLQNYGVSMTTMDEVFLKVTRTEEEKVNQKEEIQEDLLLKLSKRIHLLEGLSLSSQQFRGAFVKCALHAGRNWKIIAMQLILPAVMTILAVVQILAIPVIGTQPKVALSLAPYSMRQNGALELLTPYSGDSESLIGPFERAMGQGQKTLNLTSVDLSDWLPDTMANDVVDFDNKYILAMDMNQDSANQKFALNGWFNAEAYHAISSSLMYTNRIIAQSMFPTDNITISGAAIMISHSNKDFDI